MANQTEYIVPDLLAAWPWHRSTNPALDQELSDEANNWVASLELFERSQLKKFQACDFNLLAALCAPLQGKDYLRISCDLGNFYWAFDEYTDVVDGGEALMIVTDVIRAIRHLETSAGNSKITEMVRQFFERTVRLVGDDTEGIDHFATDFEAYAKATIQEADDRAHGHVRTVEEYLNVRRDTCGGKPSFSFFGLGLFIPQVVFDHPIMQSLTDNAADLVAMTNDMHSYALEHSRGLDGHNIITSIMHEHHVDLQGALYWLAGYASRAISKFKTDRKSLPSWGPDIDRAVNEYINRMGRCVRGYDAWSYETIRYYGKNGSHVREHRRITLEHRGLEMGYITREKLHIGVPQEV